MKYFSIIVALCVISLNMPSTLSMLVFADNSSCATSCCGATEKQDATENDGNSCENNCNPFLSCCTCSVITPVKPTLLNQNFYYIAEQTTRYKQSPIIQHTHTIWHPPKFS